MGDVPLQVRPDASDNTAFSRHFAIGLCYLFIKDKCITIYVPKRRSIPAPARALRPQVWPPDRLCTASHGNRLERFRGTVLSHPSKSHVWKPSALVMGVRPHHRLAMPAYVARRRTTDLLIASSLSFAHPPVVQEIPAGLSTATATENCASAVVRFACKTTCLIN